MPIAILALLFIITLQQNIPDNIRQILSVWGEPTGKTGIGPGTTVYWMSPEKLMRISVVSQRSRKKNTMLSTVIWPWKQPGKLLQTGLHSMSTSAVSLSTETAVTAGSRYGSPRIRNRHLRTSTETASGRRRRNFRSCLRGKSLQVPAWWFCDFPWSTAPAAREIIRHWPKWHRNCLCFPLITMNAACFESTIYASIWELWRNPEREDSFGHRRILTAVPRIWSSNWHRLPVTICFTQDGWILSLKWRFIFRESRENWQGRLSEH